MTTCESAAPIVANAQSEVIAGETVYNFSAPIPRQERKGSCPNE